MSLFLILLALPLAFIGLIKLNDKGALSASSTSILFGIVLLLSGLVCWMVAMGSLRGIFAYLGLLTAVGLTISFIGIAKEKPSLR